MAVRDLGLVPDEDLKRVSSPLNPEPIADLLGKIPGIGALLKNTQQQTSPRGVMGPGVIAQIMSGLQNKVTPGQGSPQDFYDKSIGTSEQIAGMAASLRMPGATFLQRLLSNTVLPMAEHAIQEGGQRPEIGALKGLLGAGTQAATEGVMGALKQFGMQRAAERARTAHEKALDTHKASVADDIAGDRYQQALDLTTHRKEVGAVRAENAAGKAAQSIAEQGASRQHAEQVASIRTSDAQRIRAEKAAYQSNKKAVLGEHDATTQRLQQEYETSRGIHAGQAAQIIMDDAKTVIPEWSVLPSTVPGLIDGVLGKGQKLLSDAYDTAMKAAVETARGTEMTLPLMDIRKLGVPIKGLSSTIDDAAGMPTHGVVDAGDVITKLTEMGKKRDWGVYRRTTAELDKHELGIDPAARNAYRAGQEVIEAVDTSGALANEGGKSVLNTDALFSAMHKVKNIDVIRRREDRDFYTSPIVQSAAGAPQPPTLPSKPEIDPFVPPSKTPLPAKPTVPPFLARPTPAPPTKIPFTPESPPLSPDETGAITGPELGSRGQRMSIGGGLGFLGGLATGQGGGHYYSPTTVAGIVGGAALPQQWITKAPGTEPMIELYGKLAQLFGAGARENVTPLLNDAPSE